MPSSVFDFWSKGELGVVVEASFRQHGETLRAALEIGLPSRFSKICFFTSVGTKAYLVREVEGEDGG